MQVTRNVVAGVLLYILPQQGPNLLPIEGNSLRLLTKL